MSEDYYVFSDERGHRCDSRLYLRSWIILSEKELMKLKNKIDLLKKKCGKKSELKYSSGHDYNIFMDLDFDVYFTITFCEDFNERNFDLIKELDQKENSFFNFREKNIKEKIVNTIKHSIFLNIYEFYHLENFIKFLDKRYENKKIFFFIDSPQYQNRDWEEMFSELKSKENLKIVNRSEDFEGIQFADVLAGSMEKILTKVESDSSLNDFEKFLVTKFSQQNGSEKRFLNNPQIIFWDIKYEELVQKINNLIGDS